jgi:prevent-host-death family protein
VITEASAVTLRQNLGDMLNRVQYRRDSIVITKDGKPVAALVDAALFERIRAMQERFDALCDRIAKGYENVPEDEGMAEIEAACALARTETADEWRRAGRLPPLAPAPKAASPRRRTAQPSGKTAKAKPARRASGS